MQRTWKRTVMVSLLMAMFAQSAVAQIRVMDGITKPQDSLGVATRRQVKEPVNRIPERGFSSAERQKTDHLLKHYFAAEVKTGDFNRMRTEFWSYVGSNPHYALALRQRVFGVKPSEEVVYPQPEQPDNLPWKFLRWLNRVLRDACKKHDIPNCCICDPTEHPKGSCPYCR